MKNRITKEFRSVVFANAGVLKPETFEKLEFYIPLIVELKVEEIRPRFSSMSTQGSLVWSSSMKNFNDFVRSFRLGKQ